jgi:predicted nuclease with TOPRIM domain
MFFEQEILSLKEDCKIAIKSYDDLKAKNNDLIKQNAGLEYSLTESEEDKNSLRKDCQQQIAEKRKLKDEVLALVHQKTLLETDCQSKVRIFKPPYLNIIT